MGAEEHLKQQIIEKAWQDADFKKELLENPILAIEKAFQIVIPGNAEIKVLEETKDLGYLVIPLSPEELQNSEEPIPDCTW